MKQPTLRDLQRDIENVNHLVRVLVQKEDKNHNGLSGILIAVLANVIITLVLIVWAR
jgi:hypothetical protein